MTLLLDMNLSPRWIAVLAAAGIEAIHWSQIGAPAAPDRDIMHYAREHGHIVLTHDLDFSAILAATGGRKPSVIQLRAADIRPEIMAPQVIAALQQLPTELEAGALITLSSAKSRLRLLPLTERPLSTPTSDQP